MSYKKVAITFVFSIAVIISFILGYCFSYNKNIVTQTLVRTDTFEVIKYDTIKSYVPMIKTERVVDSVVVVIKDSIYVLLPISQYHFSENGLYDFWVKGYNVSMDSSYVYPKTIYRDITKTERVIVENKKTHIFAVGNLRLSNGRFVPSAGVTITTREKWLYGAEIGFDGAFVYGVTLGYKLK